LIARAGKEAAMSVVIPDEILHATHMSADELLQELAVFLIRKKNSLSVKPVNWTG
jgi:predicted HTH domain antitoxin